MAKHRNKGGSILQSRTQTAIIPGLGVDVPELQRARALWQLNRFEEPLYTTANRPVETLSKVFGTVPADPATLGPSLRL
jgi:hypothetical protein